MSGEADANDRSSAVVVPQGAIATALSDERTRIVLHLRCTFVAPSLHLRCTFVAPWSQITPACSARDPEKLGALQWENSDFSGLA